MIVAPAHNWLYTPFDRAIGHYRRYTRKTLKEVMPPELRLERLMYLDSVGQLASLGNWLFLRQRVPTLRQILFWDRILVPCSRRLDPWPRYSVGKSVLGIWRRV